MSTIYVCLIGVGSFVAGAFATHWAIRVRFEQLAKQYVSEANAKLSIPERILGAKVLQTAHKVAFGQMKPEDFRLP